MSHAWLPGSLPGGGRCRLSTPRHTHQDDGSARIVHRERTTGRAAAVEGYWCIGQVGARRVAHASIHVHTYTRTHLYAAHPRLDERTPPGWMAIEVHTRLSYAPNPLTARARGVYGVCRLQEPAASSPASKPWLAYRSSNECASEPLPRPIPYVPGACLGYRTFEIIPSGDTAYTWPSGFSPIWRTGTACAAWHWGRRRPACCRNGISLSPWGTGNGHRLWGQLGVRQQRPRSRSMAAGVGLTSPAAPGQCGIMRTVRAGAFLTRGCTGLPLPT